MVRGLVNGIGGTVIGWTWPDPPKTPRDIIASHCRNWGPKLAYDFADTLLIELSAKGFSIKYES
mgnify:CR=1 FL=1